MERRFAWLELERSDAVGVRCFEVAELHRGGSPLLEQLRIASCFCGVERCAERRDGVGEAPRLVVEGEK